MAGGSSQEVPQEQFLTMSANLLYRSFLECSRTKAKNLFRDLAAGNTAAITTVEMEDKSQVRFDICLDHSEFIGAINFGAFRASVTLLVANLGEYLKKNEPVKVFTADQDENTMVFGVTAVTKEGEEPNILVLGAETSASQPRVLLKLMYINHEQFAQAAQEPV